MSDLGGIHEAEGSQNSVEIKELARFAVDEYNKKQNAHLEFGKVINVKEQIVAGIMYYITLEATEGSKKKTYEAKVYVKAWENFKQLEDFKLIGDVASA